MYLILIAKYPKNLLVNSASVNSLMYPLYKTGIAEIWKLLKVIIYWPTSKVNSLTY